MTEDLRLVSVFKPGLQLVAEFDFVIFHCLFEPVNNKYHGMKRFQRHVSVQNCSNPIISKVRFQMPKQECYANKRCRAATRQPFDMR